MNLARFVAASRHNKTINYKQLKTRKQNEDFFIKTFASGLFATGAID